MKRARRVALAAALVWAVDDGEKIKQDEPAATPLARGEGNPVWAPGAPIRLFAARNETVAMQIVVAADDAALRDVTVDLEALASGAARLANAKDATDPTRYVGRPIERFVEHFFDVPRASGGKDPGESLGWLPGAAPEPGRWTGRMPDALIPIEVAPSWSPYPMAIAPRTNGVVWIDVTIPRTQPPGLYKGDVVVKAGGAALASLPVELDVRDVVLPDRPVRTMLFYDPDELARRLGEEHADAAERHLWRLYHRHRLAPMHSAKTREEVTKRARALGGTFYTASEGYEGPAEGMGDGVLSLGTYGNLGAPDATKLRTVEEIAELLASKDLLGSTDVFVYATDEDCESPWGAAWKKLVAGSKSPHLANVRVAWTCSEDPTKQPVDVPMQAASFDAASTAKARAMGKEVWAYNGRLPQTGSFLTDTPATSLRVNGLLPALVDIGRWFFWETTFWYDGNKGGKGPYNPFVTAETFHNADGDWSMGDGVLVYPGRQVDRFTSHSLGMDGVVASIRLKNWRRGVEDAGWFQLAYAADAPRAAAIGKALLPKVNSDAKKGERASWSDRGKDWFEARRALAALVPKGTDGGRGLGATLRQTTAPAVASGAGASGAGASSTGASGTGGPRAEKGCGCRGCNQSGGSLVLVGAVVMAWRRARRRT